MSPDEAIEALPVDTLWRPSEYVRSAYGIGPGKATVTDEHTGCVWQQSGSPFPLDWQDAHCYIGSLDQSRFDGIGCWRLPTIAELLTLLAPPAQGEALCIEPVFDKRQASLWSCDRRSFVAAWYASLELGFIGWQDFSARHHVRAVSSGR